MSFAFLKIEGGPPSTPTTEYTELPIRGVASYIFVRNDGSTVEIRQRNKRTVLLIFNPDNSLRESSTPSDRIINLEVGNDDEKTGWRAEIFNENITPKTPKHAETRSKYTQ